MRVRIKDAKQIEGEVVDIKVVVEVEGKPMLTLGMNDVEIIK